MIKPEDVTRVQLLEAVLDWFKSGAGEYICIELKNVFQKLTGIHYADQTDDHMSHQLRAWVCAQLRVNGERDMYCSLGSWMRELHPEIDDKMRYQDYHDARIQWLEAMIVFWKGQEDLAQVRTK